MHAPLPVEARLSSARRRFFGLMALEFAIFRTIGLVWLFFLAPGVHVWWWLVPLLPIHFGIRRLTEHKVACPAGHRSLMDHEGFAMSAKACDHGGTRFH